MKATIRIVAEHAGVSRGTVDRVLHNRGNVKADVLIKVQQAIEELQYTPNEVARALAFSGSGKKLGFLLPDQPGFFYEEAMRGIRKIAAESQDLGIKIDVRTCQQLKCSAVIDEMVADGVSGFAICAQNSPQLIERINRLVDEGFPVVTVNSDIPESARNCFIGEDALRSGQVAAGILFKYLKEHQDILIVAGYPGFQSQQSRIAGCCNYLHERGVDRQRCRVIYTNGSNRITHHEVSRMLTKHPQIGCVYMAIDSIQGFVDARLAEPSKRQLFTVCHDTDAKTLHLLKQGIIDYTIDQDIFSQGYRPLQLLIDYFLHQKPISAANDKISYHIISAECIE